MKKQILTSLLCLILFFLFQYSYSATRADTSIKVNNSKYPLCVSLPKGFDASKSYPLVVALHFCGGTAEQYCTALASFCDSLQIIVASPEDNSGSELASNAFIKVSIDSMKNIYKIKSDEVYLTGMSCNGVTTLREGLAKIYPFKGIFPWAPYISSTNNKVFDFKSDVITTMSIGTDDSKLIMALSFYDSLMLYNKKTNLVLAMGIGHVLGFNTFTEEMIRSFRYINDTNAIKINKIDDVTIKDTDPVKEVSVEFTYAGNKNLNIVTRTSNPDVLPLPVATRDNNKITLSIDPKPNKADKLVYVVLEVAEQNGMAIEQVVFKVNIKSTYTSLGETTASFFEAYPIPAQDQLFFKSSENNISLVICDIFGKQIMLKKNFDVSGPLNISELKSGAYILSVRGNSFQKTLKFIVE